MPLSQAQTASFLTTSDAVHGLDRHADRIGYFVCPPLEGSEQLTAALELLGLESEDAIEKVLATHDRTVHRTLEMLLACRPRWRASRTFLCWLGLVAEYPTVIDSDELQKFGWDKEIADDVARVVSIVQRAP